MKCKGEGKSVIAIALVIGFYIDMEKNGKLFIIKGKKSMVALPSSFC